MGAAGNGAGFRIVGGALVRAVHHADVTLPGWPDLTDTGPDSIARWQDWLRRVWSVPEVGDAVGHASPELERQVRVLCAADSTGVRPTRRAVVSVARYLLRLTGRPTPSGLLAGVAAATFGDQTRVRWGSGHRAVGRADAGWLADVINQAERRPEVLERLPVVANSTLMVRGDRLIVPYQPNRDSGSGVVGGAVEVSLRSTEAVLAAIEAARRPVGFGELRAQLVVEYPAASLAKVTGMLTQLVAHRALITSLHAPSTEPDALGWLLERLEAADAADADGDLVTGLKEIHSLLERHSHAPADQGRVLRGDVAERMRRLARAPRHPVAVDLRLDASIVLPHCVAREVERAAGALARLSPHPHGTPAWREFHRLFYQRFGVGALVPLLDVVADSGIGWPDGYPGTASPERRRVQSRRDERLVTLAQAAALDGRIEVVVDERLITELAVGESGRVRLPPHLELTARVHAPDRDALQRGRFRLTVVSASRAAGVAAGRFLAVLDPDNRRELAAGLADLPGGDPDTVCAQASFPPLHPASAHVARAIQVLPRMVSLAEYRNTDAEAGVVTVEDLAVGCDSHRLYLAVPAWGRRVEAWGMHALNPRIHTPPLARFVSELPRALCAQVAAFDWGAAARLPFLPRLRYGRTVLAPARWRLDAAELPDRQAGWAAWEEALAGWRARRRLPRRVYLTDDDQRLPLDLDEPVGRALLREHLRTRQRAVLEEVPDDDAFGWIGGRAHEIVVPLAVARPPGWPPLPRPTRERVVRRTHGQTPGISALLFAKLYGQLDRQNVVLAEHLPTLLTEWGEQMPVWWFLRFRDGRDDCLRLRIVLPDSRPATFGEAAGRVSAWADELRRRGLLREVVYATSYPQTGRWGEGPALASAQAVFAADSAAVLTQLAVRTQLARPTPCDPQVLAAAHFTAIAVAFTGSTAAGMDWLTRHVPARPPAAVPRPVFAEAVRVADPREDFGALRRLPGGDTIVNAWADRSRAMAAYRAHLPGPHTSGVQVDDVLGSLLHGHFLRACGIDPQDKAVCLYLARAAALAFTARDGVRR